MPIQKASSVSKISAIETGTVIDVLSGVGGIPRGRITELWGEASLGKSTLALQAIATAQKNDLKCLYADVEWSYDARYAEGLGVDNDALGLLRDEVAETVLDEIESELRKGKYDLVVLDAIGALTSRAEHEKTSGEKTIGAQSGLVARFCRKIVPVLALKDSALLVLNHSFTDIMSGAVKSSGGAKLEFHKSLSIRLRKSNKVLKNGDKVVGKVVIASVKKNKVASTEGREIEASIMFGEGFSGATDVLQTAIDQGVITKSGNTLWFAQEKLGTIGKAREWIKDETNLQKLKDALV